MSDIQVLQPAIQFNGQTLTGKLKPLAQDITLGQARALVENRPDGYDTIGIRLGGKDYLLLTQDAEQVRPTDQLFVNGQRAQISFIETENTVSFTVGERIGMTFAGGLMGAVAGSVVGSVAGMAIDKVFPLPVGAFLGAATGITMGIIGSAPEALKLDESITDSLTDKFIIPQNAL